MTDKPSYQLTKHPIGTVREIWAISWPLMLGLCSSSFMMFADRLYLAHFSVVSMNAMAVGGLACFLFLVLPFSICQITEVFVGRYHGQERNDQVGKPIWQIIWIAFMAWPVLALISRLLGNLTFGRESLEYEYFVTMLDFCPAFMISVGIMGYFIGIGKTKVISYATILSNLLNILLAPLFIYGSKFAPSLGIKGAAIATGLAQGFQALFLLTLCLQKRWRDKFQTHKITFDLPLIKEMLSFGVPSGIGRLMEVLAFLIFFKIITLAGVNELTCATMVQCFYLLAVFCVDGISKGVTTVISNLVGAKNEHLIPKVLQSGIKVHTLVTAIMTLICFGFCEWIFSHILQKEEVGLLGDPLFSWSLKIALGWMCLFFLLDGFAWIYSGHLLALGDTKYIMNVTSVVHWFTYVLPTYLCVVNLGTGAATGWALMVVDGVVMVSLLWWRSSKKMAELAVVYK